MRHEPVLLHVGYIKTATTFLQEHVFDSPQDGLELGAGRQTRAHLVQEILLSDDYIFDPSLGRDRLEALAKPVRDRGNLPVWSEEMLLGNPPTDRYDGYSNARKLQQVFPRAKVLITIRRQQQLARSMYAEYVLGGGTLPLQAFIGTGTEPLSFSSVLRPDFLHFDRAISHYQALFGASNILVLPQELILSRPTDFFARLNEFAGSKISAEVARPRSHVSEGAVAMRIRRSSNRFMGHDRSGPGRGPLESIADRVIRKMDRVIPRAFNDRASTSALARITHRYRDMFAESNRRTSALTGLDLGRLGYDV